MATKRETESPRRGDGAGRRHGRRLPQDVMLAVVRAAVDGGANAHAVAPRFGVPYTTVAEWVRRYRADGEAISLARRTGSCLIPTLDAAQTVREIALDPSAQVSDEWRAENLEIHRAMFESFSRAVVAQVPIAFGTDAGWRPHGRHAEQFVHMVTAGMRPIDAISATAVNAAGAIGWTDRVGSLQAGY